MEQSGVRYPWGLRLIGGFKFVCGLLLVGLAIGLFRGARNGLGDEAATLVSKLKLAHDNVYVQTAIEKISSISPKQLRQIGVGTILYALMYLVEGGGLLLRKRWAEYFTVFATGFFIPLEIYEVYRRQTPVRIAILAINVVIVIYLAYQLRRKREEKVETSRVSTSSLNT